MCILQQSPSKAKIKRDIKKFVFGKKLFCPHCGSASIKKYENRYRCKLCRRPFSLISVTWLKGMKIPLDLFWMILWCWTKKMSITQASDLCDLSRPTITRWYGKFRDNIPEMDEIKLSGIIQMDEAYRGSNKNKFSIIGAKEKTKENKKKVVLKIIPKSSVDRRDAIDFMTEYVSPKSKLNTDGSSIYKKIENWYDVKHQYEIHSKWEFTLTSEIEGIWGTLTTFVRRMYHRITINNAPSIVKEFSARITYPELFNSPASFFEKSLSKLNRPIRTPGRKSKNQEKNETEFSSIYPEQINLTHVPS
jgi:transposase-like protein